MYPLRNGKSIYEQLWLFPQMRPNGQHRPVGKPARVYSRKARIAIMAIRQRLGKPLKHPDDLWNNPELSERLGERIEAYRNGGNKPDGPAPQVRCLGVVSVCEDDTLVNEVLENESKVLAAFETMLLIESLETAQKKLEKQLKTLDTCTTGQLLYLRAKIKDSLQAS